MAPIANNAKRSTEWYAVPPQQKIAIHASGFSFYSGEDKSVNVMFPSNKKYWPDWKIGHLDNNGGLHHYGHELSDGHGVDVGFIFGNQGDPGLLPMYDDNGNTYGYSFRHGSRGHVQLKYGDFFTATRNAAGTLIDTTDESCFFSMLDGDVYNLYVFRKGANLTLGEVLYAKEFACRIPGKEDIYLCKVESSPHRGELRMQKFVGDKCEGFVSVKGSINSPFISKLLSRVVPGEYRPLP